MDKNSMLYWWPIAQWTEEVYTPKTVIVWTGQRDLLMMLEGKKLPSYLENMILAASREFTYPLFVRTDQASGKHDWKDSCFVPSEDVLFNHIARVVEFNECAGMLGLPYQSLVFREYIPLESKFKAFHGEMPVAKERRYFINDGKVVCHHPYWPKEAIEQTPFKPDNWQRQLEEISSESDVEIDLLTKYAELLGQRMRGYWSIDFAKGQDGKWYFIDAALGEMSWHPECEKKLGEERI